MPAGNQLDKLVLFTLFSGSQNDITAVGMAMCKHRHIISAINVKTGEKYIYAAYLLAGVLVHVPVCFFQYDINCRFLPFWRNWLRTYRDTDPSSAAVVEANASGTRFAVPPFHIKAHR